MTSKDFQLVDAHCHLDFPDFAEEREAVIARALEAGVTRMVTICTKLKNASAVRAISEAHDPVFWAAGTHPMSAADEPLASVEDLVELARHPKMVGIGETGLDYHYTAESKPVQQESLRIHIEAARRTGLPLIIHARDADDDMARILAEEHAAAIAEEGAETELRESFIRRKISIDGYSTDRAYPPNAEVLAEFEEWKKTHS